MSGIETLCDDCPIREVFQGSNPVSFARLCANLVLSETMTIAEATHDMSREEQGAIEACVSHHQD